MIEVMGLGKLEDSSTYHHTKGGSTKHIPTAYNLLVYTIEHSGASSFFKKRI